MGINKIAAYSSKSTIMEIFEEEHGKVDIENRPVAGFHRGGFGELKC